MSKLPNDPTVAQRWGNEMDFAQRAKAATPDSLLRDLMADGRRSSPVNPWPRDPVPPTPVVAIPGSYAEWAHKRLGVNWSEDRAKDYYLTKQTAGEDVGPVDLRPGAPKGGWVEPKPLDSWRAPGIDIIDRMMDRADAIDRQRRERTGY